MRISFGFLLGYFWYCDGIVVYDCPGSAGTPQKEVPASDRMPLWRPGTSFILGFTALISDGSDCCPGTLTGIPPVTSDTRVAKKGQRGAGFSLLILLPSLCNSRYTGGEPARRFFCGRHNPGPLTRAITTKPWIILTICRAPVSSVGAVLSRWQFLPPSAFICTIVWGIVQGFRRLFEDCRNRVYFKWGCKYINLWLDTPEENPKRSVHCPVQYMR